MENSPINFLIKLVLVVNNRVSQFLKRNWLFLVKYFSDNKADQKNDSDDNSSYDYEFHGLNFNAITASDQNSFSLDKEESITN